VWTEDKVRKAVWKVSRGMLRISIECFIRGGNKMITIARFEVMVMKLHKKFSINAELCFVKDQI